MRAYIVVTGTVFALVTLAHLARTPQIIAEFAADPWSSVIYNVLTLATAALTVWAWRLYRRSAVA